MVRSMKILIHDERSDAPEFLLKLLANRGYRAGFAKNVTDITAMLSNDRYDFVLTNGKYKTLSADHYARLHTSVFIIGITDSQNHTQDVRADVYLARPFLISELWRALEAPFKLCED